MQHRFAAAFLLAILASITQAGVKFNVRIDPSVRKEMASGRLIVMLVKEDSKVNPAVEPLSGPFWDDPQPMFGIDVKGLEPGSVTIEVGEDATYFPVKMSELPPGNYRAQARLEVSRTNSDWKRIPGNLSSAVVKFAIDDTDQSIAIVLDKKVIAPQPRVQRGVDLFEIKSELLSKFYGRDVMLRAGIAYPLSYNPLKKYAAIYSIPGYGGDHFEAFQQRRSAVVPGMPEEAIGKATFAIYLDPESPNGHTLFADSANNGPWAQALIKELIPALEAKYKLMARPEARLLRGHSSGGWSSLWLAINYPETFGATWSSSPDPVDFRKFQVVDIYGQPNFYYDPAGKVDDPAAELGAYRRDGKIAMTIRQENLMEEVLGPSNTSAQQWDSWFAVFGPRAEDGTPVALFDPKTGAINKEVAEQYRKYDVAELVRNSPEKYLPIFQKNVRLLVGAEDNFALNEAVALLEAEIIKRLASGHTGPPDPGYIKILPGCDHGTIVAKPEMRQIPAQMVEHLTKSGCLPK
ncbi:MAG: hypothetical protein IT435_13480 [Phycisphaerales bacterium]|nr:hypothetical protein [Phycisphaerales bacterium]